MSLIQYRPGGGTGIVGSSKGGIGVGPMGPTGPTGPQGLQGPAGTVVSAFTTINGGSVTLTTSYSLILSTTITTTGSGYILGHSTVQVKNDDNVDHFVDFYMVVNGGTSNLTSEDVRKPSGGVSGYANLTIIYRCNSIPAGTYPLEIWGRSRLAATNLVVDHADISGLGNLA
jgi:hypothetical protein